MNSQTKTNQTNDSNSKGQLCVKGAFIEKRYIKCPHTSIHCKWRFNNNHIKGYEYLNGACYLSGSFPLDCPE